MRVHPDAARSTADGGTGKIRLRARGCRGYTRSVVLRTESAPAGAPADAGAELAADRPLEPVGGRRAPAGHPARREERAGLRDLARRRWSAAAATSRASTSRRRARCKPDGTFGGNQTYTDPLHGRLVRALPRELQRALPGRRRGRDAARMTRDASKGYKPVRQRHPDVGGAPDVASGTRCSARTRRWRPGSASRPRSRTACRAASARREPPSREPPDVRRVRARSRGVLIGRFPVTNAAFALPPGHRGGDPQLADHPVVHRHPRRAAAFCARARRAAADRRRVGGRRAARRPRGRGATRSTPSAATAPRPRWGWTVPVRAHPTARRRAAPSSSPATSGSGCATSARTAGASCAAAATSTPQHGLHAARELPADPARATATTGFRIVFDAEEEMDGPRAPDRRPARRLRPLLPDRGVSIVDMGVVEDVRQSACARRGRPDPDHGLVPVRGRTCRPRSRRR